MRDAARSKYSEAEAHLYLGHLKRSKTAAQQAADMAQSEIADQGQALAYVGHILALWGDRAGAKYIFECVQNIQNKIDKTDRLLYSHRGIFLSLMHLRLGEIRKAEEIAVANLDILTSTWGPDGRENQHCRILMAAIACRVGDFRRARQQLTVVFDWAVSRDAKVELCWSALVRAEIAVAEAQVKSDGRPSMMRPSFLEEAQRSLDEGLRFARSYGYGIYHIDLLNLRALVYLLEGQAQKAERDARIALTEGWSPDEDTGRPHLPAAVDQECHYVWGEAAARHRLGEALLLQAAGVLGTDRYVPDDENSLPPAALGLLRTARIELQAASDLRALIGDPALDETRSVLANLENGKLTIYPLIQTFEPEPNDNNPNVQYHRRRFQVALSFAGENREFVAKVAAELARVLGKDRVFYDRYYESELARVNLDTYLQKIYHDESDLIVVFFGNHYEQKDWCRLEWRAVRELIKKRRDDEIIPVRFDDTHIEGLFSIDGYLSVNGRSPEDIARLILERVNPV